MRWIRICFALFSVFVIPWAARAAEFTSTDFQALDPVIVPGGYSTSSSYALWGAIAQIAIGTSTSNSFEARSGFLYFPAPASTPASTPASSSASPSGGPIFGSLALDFLRTFLPPVEQTERRVVVVPCVPPTDLNCDGNIGIEDFSIFLYVSASPERALADLNRDGKIDIRDISVLFFHWTARVFALSPFESRTVLTGFTTLENVPQAPAPPFLSDAARPGDFATALESLSQKGESGAQAANILADILDVWKRAFMRVADIFANVVDMIKTGIHFFY